MTIPVRAGHLGPALFPARGLDSAFAGEDNLAQGTCRRISNQIPDKLGECCWCTFERRDRTAAAQCRVILWVRQAEITA